MMRSTEEGISPDWDIIEGGGESAGIISDGHDPVNETAGEG